jgi:NurA domain-containing protein
MPLDYQQVYTRIQEIGEHAGERRKILEERREKARTLFNLYADALDGLNRIVDAAKVADPALRCAAPFTERLDARTAPPDDLPSNAVLIAADGSQINPDRHASAQFGLINVGAIAMRLGSGISPQIYTDSQLLFDEELFTPTGAPLTDGMVALRRDIAERTSLDRLASQCDDSVPVITFTDGPMELWGSRDGEEASTFEQGMDAYLGVLSQLQSRGVVTAGYIDKPSSGLVVRLLELTLATSEDLKKLREFRPLLGVSDRWLFGDRKAPLLGPGERSAVFRFQARSERTYTGQLSLHFFYVNVGSEGHPWPVRVEIPRWVADDPHKLGMLHRALVDQCHIMGSRPYPYLLHRAHETAVVSHDEKRQVEDMLIQELRRAGEDPDEGSHKQSAKDLPGRTRR